MLSVASSVAPGVEVVVEESSTTGIALIVLGFALRVWACTYLYLVGVVGDTFNALVPPPKGYTNRGPYRLMKHPAYLGTIMIQSGIGVLALGWGGLALSVPSWPFFNDRSKAEERIRRAYEETR